VTDIIVNGKIKDKVKNGLEEFDRIQLEIQNAVKDLIPQISHNMGRAGTATGDLINTDCTQRSLSTSVIEHSKKNTEFSEPRVDYAFSGSGGETADEFGRAEKANITSCKTVHLLFLYHSIRLLWGVFSCIVHRVMPFVSVGLYHNEAYFHVAAFPL